jgi:hypothetical protein
MSVVGLVHLTSEFVEVGVPPGGLFGPGFDPWYCCIGSIVDDDGDVGDCMEGLLGAVDVAEVYARFGYDFLE